MRWTRTTHFNKIRDTERCQYFILFTVYSSKHYINNVALRHVAIAFPFKYRAMDRPKRMIIVDTGVWLFSFAPFYTLYLQYQIRLLQTWFILSYLYPVCNNSSILHVDSPNISTAAKTVIHLKLNQSATLSAKTEDLEKSCKYHACCWFRFLWSCLQRHICYYISLLKPSVFPVF